jgi:hypothetical protein
MPGKSWTTKEQDEFLEEYHEKYKEAKKTMCYDKFWPLVDEAWFKKYPENDILFPDRLITDLTEIEQDSLRNAFQKRQSVSAEPIVSKLALSNYHFIRQATQNVVLVEAHE